MKSVNSTTLPLINNINRKLIYQFTLDGKNLPLSDIMDNLTLTWDIGLEQYSIGNVYIRELQFSVKNTVFVNYKSKINISVKIEGDSYTYNLGKFYVDTVTEQGVTKQIKAYDDMFLLNVGYFPSAKHTTTKAIIDDICSQKGLTLVGWNDRTANINNEQLEGKTVLEMLKLVSCVHGGTFFFDGDGALKFVQTNDTGITYTKSDYATPTLDTSISYKITKLKVVYGEKILNDDEEGTVKDEGFYEVGEGLDAQTLAISNVLLKGQQAQAQRILDSIKIMNGYKRFDTTVLLGDFRLEPMDLVTYVKDDISYKVPIIYLKATLSHGGLLVETKSPTLAESKNEFSFKGTLTQKVDNIYTDMIQVKDIVANSITVGDLNAINATIENLKATDATITNLLAGNITSENIQSGSITSDRLVIDDGFVKDAMIDTISANKIMSGSIDTGAITIQSDNGRMIIADETIQISDGTHVRVQIGETGNGDYALVIYDANGNVMFDATGITENAIKSAIIKDNMVADNANINAQKIDINSLFTVINEDGSHTLNGSKIFLDTQNQTLNVAFNNMTTKQDDLEEQTNVLSTQVNVQSGKIETLIRNNTITEEGQTITLKDKVSSIEQDLDGITLQVGTVESNVTDLEKRVSKAELKITDDAIVSTVANSQVFKNAISGGKNLIRNSAFMNRFKNWEVKNATIDGISYEVGYIQGYGNKHSAVYLQKGCKLEGEIIPSLMKEETYTFSCLYSTDSSIYDDGIKIQIVNGVVQGGGKEDDTILAEYVLNPYDTIPPYDTTLPYDSNRKIVFTFTTPKRFIASSSSKDAPAYVRFEPIINEDTPENERVANYFTNIKFEQGSVATDWCLAQEDLDDNEKNISDLTTKVTNCETKIEQNAENITLCATKTEVTSEIKKVNVGVRNLVRNSAFIKGFDYWECGTGSVYVIDEDVKTLNGHPSIKFYREDSNAESINGSLISQEIDIDYNNGVAFSGETYIISCWYYCEDASTFTSTSDNKNITFTLRGTSNSTITTIGGAVVWVDEKDFNDDNTTSPIVVGKWTKMEGTFTLKESFPMLDIVLAIYGGGEVWFTDFMVTKGNKAPSAWVAAPEDTTEAIDAIEQQVVTNTQSIASLMINADSISASVQRVEQSVTSSLDGVNQNITSLTNRVDATMSAEDIKFEISKELSNGVTNVTTSTGFTFDESGLTIDKSDSEMSTQITEDGMTISKNDETVLTANNKGVQAKNLYATTYLIVGNSRFESYKGNRTGCFYVFEPSINMAEETNLLNEEGEE